MFRSGMWKPEAEVVEAVKFLWKQKHLKKEAEANSEAFDFLRSQKWKHFS